MYHFAAEPTTRFWSHVFCSRWHSNEFEHDQDKHRLDRYNHRQEVAKIVTIMNEDDDRPLRVNCRVQYWPLSWIESNFSKYLRSANIVMYCISSETKWDATEERKLIDYIRDTQRYLRDDVPEVLMVTKSDLVRNGDSGALLEFRFCHELIELLSSQEYSINMASDQNKFDRH